MITEELDIHLDWLDEYVRHNCDLQKTCNKCPMLYRRGSSLDQFCLWYEFVDCINEIKSKEND